MFQISLSVAVEAKSLSEQAGHDNCMAVNFLSTETH